MPASGRRYPLRPDSFACRSGSAGRWPATPGCSNNPAPHSMYTPKPGDRVGLRG